MKPSIIIIGAGASGLFCAGLLGQKGFNVNLIDNGKKPGRKILMSGGGKCNFTNLDVESSNYLSHNPHFCKSALKRFTQWDFIQLVNQYNIPYHEKELGQQFCDNSAQDIVNMLVSECEKGQVTFKMQTEVEDVCQTETGFELLTTKGKITADKVIVATGGLSMPKLGVTTIGYKIAEKFNLPIKPLRAGLVPFTLQKNLLDLLMPLAGVAVFAEVSTVQKSFKGNILFTHRGLSGPAVLQASSYWQAGEAITIDLLPDTDLDAFLTSQKEAHPNQSIKNALAQLLPKRLIDILLELKLIPELTLKQLNDKQQTLMITNLHHWSIVPNGTEGYRTAEVTLGGIDTDALSSKTMAVKSLPDLYFIGEVVDVSGWLGGYNFQWAWSSAWACADDIIQNGV